MVQQDETTQQALAYIRHQASKGLAGLRVLAERTAADCGRCLEGMSEEQARFKPGDEWSVKEVLDHLIYSTARAVIEPIRDLGGWKVPRPPRHQRADRFASAARHGPCPADREDQGRPWLPGGLKPTEFPEALISQLHDPLQCATFKNLFSVGASG